MFEGLAKNLSMAWVRATAQAIAGGLATQGIITGSQTNDFVGCAIFLATVAWSSYDKWQADKKLTAAKQ